VTLETDEEEKSAGSERRVLLSRGSRSGSPSGRDGHLQRRQRQPLEDGERLVEGLALGDACRRDTERAMSQENVALVRSVYEPANRRGAAETMG
jgi:hypothetical protein